MITMVNYNSEDSVRKYNFIFEKAWQDLKDPKNANIGLGLLDNDKDSSNTQFTDLGHYFSYLQKLIQIDPLYILLPADEAPFEINANERSIKVPSNFAKCSGVQFDNYAEIITFTIDRYFDYQDLSNAQIAVQWITPDNKEGVSFIDLIDLVTLKHEHKIRFGWPLASEMTAKDGNLKFAVRFFTSSYNEDGELVYNYVFNTAPAEIPIKSTLNVDFQNAEFKKSNDYALFKDYVISSPYPSEGLAQPVQFVEKLPETARINIKTDTLNLFAQASTKDRRTLTYEWYYIPSTIIVKGYFIDEAFYGKSDKTQIIEGADYTLYIDLATDKTYIWKDEKFVEGVKPVEKKIILNNETLLENAALGEAYNIVSDFLIYNPEIWPTDRPNIDFWVPTGVEGNYREYTINEPWPKQVQEGETVEDSILTTDEITLYVKRTQLEFKPSLNQVTGSYYVKASNIVANSPYAPPYAISGPCEIKAPEEIVLEKDFEFPTHKFIDEEDLALKLVLKNDIEKPYRKYELYKDDNSEPVNSHSPEANGINSTSFNITECGKYVIKAYSDLNRTQKTYETTECFVSEHAAIPGCKNISITPISVKNLDNNEVKTSTTNTISINSDAMDKYTLTVVPYQDGESYTIDIINKDGSTTTKEFTVSDYSIGEVSYEWLVSIQDGAKFVPVKEAPIEVVDKNANINSTSLDINILASDAGEGKPVYTYKCIVTNELAGETPTNEFFFYFT